MFYKSPITELPVLDFHGSEYSIGCSMGESLRHEINELYELRLEAAHEHALLTGRSFSEAEILTTTRRHLNHLEAFDRYVFEEFSGIAEGAKLSLEKLFLMQGLTDIRDELTWSDIDDACTSLLVDSQEGQSRGPLLAQNWDLHSNNMSYVCLVRRHPLNGPKTISLTTVGCLSLVGMNEHGLSVGTTNIKSLDNQPGVHYLAMIHRCLYEKNVEDAKKVIINCHRAGAHYYTLADANSVAGIECTATRYAEMPKRPIQTHCNHILSEDLKMYEAQEPQASSSCRQKRVDQLVTDKKGICVETAKNILSNRSDGENSINRYGDSEGFSTNASIIIEPKYKTLYCCRSQPDRGNWQAFSV